MKEEKCPNCSKPNLIHRAWLDDNFPNIWCGWCESEYRLVKEKLVLFKVHNNHLTARQKERIRLAKAV